MTDEQIKLVLSLSKKWTSNVQQGLTTEFIDFKKVWDPQFDGSVITLQV
jgi:hypothetical protein